jgi:hypothetical protein
MYQHVCPMCDVSFSSCRRESLYCRRCIKVKPINTEGYEYSEKATGRLVWRHREMCEAKLARRLYPNEHVHHIDGNGKNNQWRNLVILSRSDHIKLHRFLDSQYRAMLSKGDIKNIENCWNTLIAPMTTAWLETTGANVIKIWEIGQPAAERHESAEGSETMHDTPDHLVEGDDIVQTTTPCGGRRESE